MRENAFSKNHRREREREKKPKFIFLSPNQKLFPNLPKFKLYGHDESILDNINKTMSVKEMSSCRESVTQL